MIRCYEAKLSKNLNPRVRSFIMKNGWRREILMELN